MLGRISQLLTKYIGSGKKKRGAFMDINFKLFLDSSFAPGVPRGGEQTFADIVNKLESENTL